MTPIELQANLDQFTGTDQYHRHFTGLLYTDGVQYLAENAGAYWLIDLIGSYQPKCRKDEMLAAMQFWTLTVDQTTHKAVAVCERDTDDEAFRQAIPYSDFPLSEIKLWVEYGGAGAMVLMLPSEH